MSGGVYGGGKNCIEYLSFKENFVLYGFSPAGAQKIQRLLYCLAFFDRVNSLDLKNLKSIRVFFFLQNLQSSLFKTQRHIKAVMHLHTCSPGQLCQTLS